MTRRPVTTAVTVLAVAALAALVGGCSDDDASQRDRSTTTTAADATSTSAAPVADGSTLPLGGDTGTTPSLPEAFVAPGEPSPLALGTGAPEPEYPAGGDGTVETLADGDLDLIVQQVDEASGAVLVGVVQLVVGDGAEDAARVDGKLRPDEELTGNYYVRDPNPKLRVVLLADDVRLRGEAADGSIAPTTGRGPVAAALIERLGVAPGIPYRGEIAGGRIVALTVPDVIDPTVVGG